MTAQGTAITAIDPGSEQSAYLVWLRSTVGLPGKVIDKGILPNDEVLAGLRDGRTGNIVVIEQIESYGMAVGAEIFATVHWSGRFTEAAERHCQVVQLPRRRVKLAICHDSRAKDANIRQALLDRFGGKAAAVGTKAAPGPLYGISKDVWSALAIALTFDDEGTLLP